MAAEPSGWWALGAAAITGGLTLGGIVYTAMQKRFETLRQAQSTEKVSDGNNVTTAFATSQGQVQYWADKFGEISEKYGAVLASQAAQDQINQRHEEDIAELKEALKQERGLRSTCEQDKAALRGERDQALAGRQEYKDAFDSLVVMTQMAQSGKTDEGLLNVAEQRIRAMLDGVKGKTVAAA